jgi:hypothetical protein
MLQKIVCSCLVVMISFVSLVSADTPPAFLPGETLVYQIRKFAMSVGEISLVYEGRVTREDRELLLLTLTARAPRFNGVDHIYLDPGTFFPVLVERDIVFMGKNELIREDYDPQHGRVKITKTVSGKTSTDIITKDGPLENIYGFIFRYRQDGREQQDQKFLIRLPTQEVTMSYSGTRSLKTDDGNVEASFLESSPRSYRIWLDPSPRQIPLRIDGAAGFGNTAMVLKEYLPGQARSVE